jgi:hypothetical protein
LRAREREKEKKEEREGKKERRKEGRKLLSEITKLQLLSFKYYSSGEM